MEDSYLRKRKKLYNITKLNNLELEQFGKAVLERPTDILHIREIDNAGNRYLEHITTDKILLFPRI